MAAAIGAGVAAAGLIGDFMSRSGQQQTNAQNMALQMQEEQWQEKMSDTAVQRRMADLKAAGVNPMLAAGQAASQPATGLAVMQNPNAAFSNAGQVAAGAAQTASNVNLQNAQAHQADAQADLIKSQTPTPKPLPIGKDAEGNEEVTVRSKDTSAGIIGDATVEQIKSVTGLNNTKAQEAQANINLINQNIQTGITQADLNQHLSRLQGVNADTLQGIQSYAISQQKALGARSDVESQIASTWWGKIAIGVGYILHGTGSAQGVATATGVGR